jgi:catechol 2,3-dioxygenase-like lactoylglutathione lyase family enzyme
MSPVEPLIAGIRAFRPFLPAKDYPASLRFYEAVGFKAYHLGEAMASMSLGPHAFILHSHGVEPEDSPWVMHVLVEDVRGWWRHLDSLDLARRFGVPALGPPRDEPWGLTVVYLSDPSGTLWHFAQDTVSMKEKG